MSVRVMSWVWEHGPADQTELLVLLALADFSDDAGRCFPSMASIARKARFTERGARGVVRRLEAAGWLTVQVNGGRGGANRYQIARANPEPETRNDKPGTSCPPERDDTKPGTSLHKTRNHASAEPSRTIRNRQKELPIGSSRARARKPEVPIPEDWTPSEKNLSDAYDRQFTDEEIRNEAAQFRDHHLARGTRFRDWDAAWRTWLANARKFAPRVVAGRAVARGRGQGSSLASIVARRRLDGGL